jgi:hypothetical protein
VKAVAEERSTIVEQENSEGGPARADEQEPVTPAGKLAIFRRLQAAQKSVGACYIEEATALALSGWLSDPVDSLRVCCVHYRLQLVKMEELLGADPHLDGARNPGSPGNSAPELPGPTGLGLPIRADRASKLNWTRKIISIFTRARDKRPKPSFVISAGSRF